MVTKRSRNAYLNLEGRTGRFDTSNKVNAAFASANKFI